MPFYVMGTPWRVFGGFLEMRLSAHACLCHGDSIAGSVAARSFHRAARRLPNKTVRRPLRRPRAHANLVQPMWRLCSHVRMLPLMTAFPPDVVTPSVCSTQRACSLYIEGTPS